MDTNNLKKFAQAARNLLIDQVTSKLDMVLDSASAARRENPEAVKDLEGAIRKTSRDQVIEKVAYTWFNRFTALRFMDANGYTSIQVVSPTEGQTRPEILSEAMAGHIDDSVAAPIKEQVVALLDGRSPSSDPQGEAYRVLLVATCNQWHGPMPFLFEKIDDYTELLMPEDLLSQTSILAELRDVMSEEACQDVEIIGWLYQFYISEKKDEVFAGLKKNKKITAENIPAATQLFTPHWIVRYLVENSLGRLWLQNKPESKVAQKMAYYIAPEEPETDFLKVSKPEEIRICDPASGSGHMLTYAFDLLYAIYEEEGYEPTEIPALILRHNLTGIEIDDRAGALAAFALTMKAAAKLGRRRFLRMEVKPDIVVLHNVSFTDAEMQDVIAVVGKDLFTDELRETLGQFEQAKNFGSLIVPKLRDPLETLRVVEARDFSSDLLLKEVQERVIAVLRMAEALSPKYHVVVANPPYMGSKGMNGKLNEFAKVTYPLACADLMTCFMEKADTMVLPLGYWSMINLPSWMFIQSFAKLRQRLLSDVQFLSLVHLGRGVFGADFGAVAFSMHKPSAGKVAERKKGTYRRLFEKSSIVRDAHEIEELFFNKNYGLFEVEQSRFQKIPDSPISYWAPETVFDCFGNDSISNHLDVCAGLTTGDTERFLRQWHEVDISKFSKTLNSVPKNSTFVPYDKGGSYRKWYGNNDYALWYCEAAFSEMKLKKGHRPDGLERFFRPSITWSKITISSFSARFSPESNGFDATSSSAFGPQNDIEKIILLLNSALGNFILNLLNSTMVYLPRDIKHFPINTAVWQSQLNFSEKFSSLVGKTKSDWDAYETSWGFTSLPLLLPDHCCETLKETYTSLRSNWQSMTDEMQALEEENNRIFIDAYGLQDELTPEVPIEEITLTSNPAYRYGVKGAEEDREMRLRADTMAEFLSYAVGCMFGRYSIDEPGLILANRGETLEEYLARVPEPSFMPDDDNVIPILDGDWFPDDITERFRLFLRTTFGEAHFRENLKYVEDALGKDIRKYFTKDFYADHVKRYKKRPIYWMFSSPKGTFNALIYMHRYRADTVSVLLNDYLREFINKLEAERSRLEKLADDESASQSQRTKALKDAAKIATQLDELRDWERDVIFPLAQQKIEIDLDDGVKANYPKFGTALKKIPGVSE